MGGLTHEDEQAAVGAEDGRDAEAAVLALADARREHVHVKARRAAALGQARERGGEEGQREPDHQRGGAAEEAMWL